MVPETGVNVDHATRNLDPAQAVQGDARRCALVDPAGGDVVLGDGASPGSISA
jgi:hypothetical protein